LWRLSLLRLHTAICWLRKPAIAHQGADLGIAAPEGAIRVRGIDGVANGEKIIDESFGDVLVIESTRCFFEGFSSV